MDSHPIAEAWSFAGDEARSVAYPMNNEVGVGQSIVWASSVEPGEQVRRHGFRSDEAITLGDRSRDAQMTRRTVGLPQKVRQACAQQR